MRALLVACALWTACAGCAPPKLGAAAIVRPIRRPFLAPSLPYEPFEVRTADALTLRGWLFRPEGQPRGLIVFLHGKDDVRTVGLEAAHRFVPEGWLVLLYDQRAHGESDGAYTTYGFREVDDLRRAIDAVGAKHVIVMGTSLGGAVALQAAPEDPRIAGVVAMAPFSDLTTIIREIAGPLAQNQELFTGSLKEAERLTGFEAARISPREAARRISVPVLLAHGTRDTFTVPSHSERIYAALQGPKRYVIVDGATHYDIPYFPALWDVIERWVDSTMTPG